MNLRPPQFTLTRMLIAMVFFAVAASIFAQAARSDVYVDGVAAVLLGGPVLGAGVGYLFGRAYEGFVIGVALAFTTIFVLMPRSFH